MKTTCAMIVKVRDKILVCKTTNSTRYDLPKGIADEGESHLTAALRELHEETGLELPPVAITDVGMFKYNSEKMIHFFYCEVDFINLDLLHCTSFFEFKGKQLPEVSGYDTMTFGQFSAVTGKAMKAAIALAEQRIKELL